MTERSEVICGRARASEPNARWGLGAQPRGIMTVESTTETHDLSSQLPRASTPRSAGGDRPEPRPRCPAASAPTGKAWLVAGGFFVGWLIVLGVWRAGPRLHRSGRHRHPRGHRQPPSRLADDGDDPHRSPGDRMAGDPAWPGHGRGAARVPSLAAPVHPARQLPGHRHRGGDHVQRLQPSPPVRRHRARPLGRLLVPVAARWCSWPWCSWASCTPSWLPAGPGRRPRWWWPASSRSWASARLYLGPRPSVRPRARADPRGRYPRRRLPLVHPERARSPSPTGRARRPIST